MHQYRPQQQRADTITAAGCWTASLCVLVLGIAATAAHAAPVVNLSPTTYKQLTGIHEQIDKQAYDRALGSLKQLLADNTLRPYEEAVILQTLGYVQISRDSYPDAIRAFEESLALERLPEQTQQRLRYDLAQLYMTVNQAAKTANILEGWLIQAENPPAEAHALLGNAYARQQQYRKAIPPLRRAITLADKAQPDWYEALLAMHYELQSYQACIPLLENILRLFPGRSNYWRQLAAVHMALDDHTSAVTTLELAYRDGALQQEQELIQLAQLYLYTGMPYKAAHLVQEQMNRGIRNNAQSRELLARAWSDAKEKQQAIQALEHAVKYDSRPEFRLRLAHWYFEEERWRAAVTVLEPLAGSKTDRTSAQAMLLLGIAHYELGDLMSAQNAFQGALQSRQTRSSARQWLDFTGEFAQETAPESNTKTKKSGSNDPHAKLDSMGGKENFV